MHVLEEPPFVLLWAKNTRWRQSGTLDLHGAGTADTPAALTWDQKQIDAATAYMKNTSRPSAGRALGKGEVNTQSGRTRRTPERIQRHH